MRFRRPSPCAIGMALVAWFLAGCGTPAATSTSIPPTDALVPPLPTPELAFVAGEVVASSEERISSPDVPIGDLRTLASGNNAFAFDLYQAIRDGEDNLLYSPYSISVSLAMVYAGARGETERQMADTLHFNLPQQRLHPAFNALDLQLAGRSPLFHRDESGKEGEGAASQLKIANAVWGQAGYPFLPEYLDLLALNYGAGVRLADFQANAPAAVDAINHWISEETEGRIRGVVDELPAITRLVLANAVYFKAEWALPFDEEDTEDEPFYLLAGGEEIVPMMHRRADSSYTEGDGYQAIMLLHWQSPVAMVIVLPREGRFREVEERLSSEWVQDVVTGFQVHEVILTMPKVRYETPALRLAETLSAMGMPDAFSLFDADFSGITGTRAGATLFIEKVLHKAFIEFNEKGTEAAAATLPSLTLGLPPDEPTEPPLIVMKIDRPFVFLILDLGSNAILFVGRVMNPASE